MDLKTAFRRYGLSQQEVARLLMKPSRVSQILNDLVKPSRDQKLQLLRLLTTLIERGKDRWPDSFAVTKSADKAR